MNGAPHSHPDWLWNASMIGEWLCLHPGPSLAPSPLLTMPVARTTSLLFHNRLHFFLTQCQESEPGRLASMSQHVLQLFTWMPSLSICVSEIASMYYFKWEKLDTVIYIYIVCFHLCNLSQPKFLHVSKCLSVIAKHNEYIINCISYLQRQWLWEVWGEECRNYYTLFTYFWIFFIYSNKAYDF